MSSLLESCTGAAFRELVELEERAIERMLVLPGDWGARVYTWIETDDDELVAVRSEVVLTQDVTALTIERRPFGERP